jgi:uncharacterized protein (DUF427 family)
MKVGALLESFLGLTNRRSSSSLAMSSLPEECVWDYPRPAICEPFEGELSIELKGGVKLVDKAKGYRTLETSHPPTYYIHRDNINMKYLAPNGRATNCEWKGQASYFDLLDEEGKVVASNVAWTYSSPTPTFTAIAAHLSFYAQYFASCSVNDEKVQPQEGDFYGGWLTANLKGPFKGGPGTFGW